MNSFFLRLSRHIPNKLLVRLLYLYTCGIQPAFFRHPRLNDKKLSKLSAFSEQTADRRLLVDVSHQVYTQIKSGIPRVVNKVSLALTELPQNDFSFEFVMLLNGELTTARRFTERILHLPKGYLGVDEKIVIREGDQMLILDNVMDKYSDFLPYFDQVHRFRGKVATVMNDMMPLQHPEWLPEAVVTVFLNALPQVILKNDVIFCVSRSTEEDLRHWGRKHMPAAFEKLRTIVFTQGADIGTPAFQATPLREPLVRFIRQSQKEKAAIFTQVSIIQPRKGQDFALDAFETLWDQDENFRLVYVGRKGWKAEALYQRIRSHPEMGKRFLFVEDASETELAAIFDASTALISPSRGEGYGLPVVEAALRKLPVLVSDIPIYHEVAGEGGIFFPLDDPGVLCDCVREVAHWTPEQRRARAAKVNVGTWEQGARDILAGLLA